MTDNLECVFQLLRLAVKGRNDVKRVTKTRQLHCQRFQVPELSTDLQFGLSWMADRLQVPGSSLKDYETQTATCVDICVQKDSINFIYALFSRRENSAIISFSQKIRHFVWSFTTYLLIL